MSQADDVTSLSEAELQGKSSGLEYQGPEAGSHSGLATNSLGHAGCRRPSFRGLSSLQHQGHLLCRPLVLPLP